MGDTHNIFATQTALALILGWAVNWAKSSQVISFMNAETAKLNHLIAAFVAALASVSITATWTAATHTLTITNITWAGIGLLFWNFIKQYAYQHSASKLFEIVEFIQKLSNQLPVQPPKA